MKFPKLKSGGRILPLLFLASSLGLLLGACGKNSKPPVTVNVIPSFFKLPPGGEVQLAAQVGGSGNQAVAWKLTGLSKGTLSSTGLYQAPLLLGPNDPSTATILATSQADPNVTANAAVSITSLAQLAEETVAPDVNTIAIGGFTVRSSQTIDLNGDGRLDLVTSDSQGVTIFLGLDNGLFLKKSPEILVNQPVALAIADFIKDASFVADVAVASRGDRKIYIFSGSAGTPQAAFSNPLTPIVVDLQAKIPSALAGGGFHGDPQSGDFRSDLAVGTEDGTVVLFLQNLDGSFTMGAPISVGAKPIQLAAADVNQDTFLDLAVVLQGTHDVLIFRGDGQGNLAGPTPVSFSSPPTAIAFGDFNGDGFPDLAAAHGGANQVSLSLGKGDGTFQSPVYTPVESAPSSIVAQDLNLDRVIATSRQKGNAMSDIAVSLPDSRALLVLFGDGAGNFIGKLRYDIGAASRFLVSGFFTSFQVQQGFQSVGLIYINPTDGKFYLLNNTSS